MTTNYHRTNENGRHLLWLSGALIRAKLQIKDSPITNQKRELHSIVSRCTGCVKNVASEEFC